MSLLARLAVVAALALPGAALAQHADYVLFGTSKPAAEVTEEQKFVHPITTPYFAEDSFVTTDLRAWYVYHSFPKGGVINGGSAKDYALQIRLALTDTIQFVAYKDGYLDFDSGLLKDAGWNDLAAGLKWNFIQNWKEQFHVAAGAGYQFAFGDSEVLQNDQELRVWASVDKGFGPLHLGGTVNGLWATGSEDPLGNSDRFIWNAHADYFVCKWFSPVVELSGFHTFNKGNEVIPVNGIDVANLGGGGDVVTAGVGFEVRPVERLGVRAAYELPLTDADNDLYGWRITASVVYSF